MSYRIKDYYKNVLIEFDTFEEMDTYISASQFTSSVYSNEESASLGYFEYDFDLWESFESRSLDEGSRELIRVTYLPGIDDES
jgi:hypothetical protein